MSSSLTLGTFGKTGAIQILEKILRLQTVVPIETGPKTKTFSCEPNPLILQGVSLARLFAKSTTLAPGNRDEHVDFNLVIPCNAPFDPPPPTVPEMS